MANALKRISQRQLLDRLEDLDRKLVDIWLEDRADTNSDELWDLFVFLLESRVQLLATCRDAGLVLAPERVLPAWLTRLCDSRREVRVRELRMLSGGQKKKMKIYEKLAREGGVT